MSQARHLRKARHTSRAQRESSWKRKGSRLNLVNSKLCGSIPIFFIDFTVPAVAYYSAFACIRFFEYLLLLNIPTSKRVDFTVEHDCLNSGDEYFII